MADVYKAFDTQLERDVAIKIIRKDAFLPSTQERMLKRFEREAKSQAKMSHPNIVRVYDFGIYEKTPYLVMEYLPGGTLKDHMGKPVPWTKAAALLTPIAHALEYAHELGILHRDVKPANILITAKGQPVLTDFGIAKLLEDESGHTLTGTGVGIGTPEYMAPEQGLGNEVDGRADVYALGVVLYELVTGQKPYSANTPMAVLLKQMNDPLPRDLVPNLPEPAERIIFKALAKNPADRYASMDQFASALENLYVEKERFKNELVEKSEQVKAEPWVQETTFESVKKEAEADRPNGEKSAKRKSIIWWILASIGILGLLIPFSFSLLTNYSGTIPTPTRTTLPDKHVYAAASPEITAPFPTLTRSSAVTLPALVPSISFTIPATATTIPSLTATTTPEKNEKGAGNNNNGGFAAIQGEWIYYINTGGSKEMHRMNLDGSKTELVPIRDVKDHIYILNDWMYFSNYSGLYRIKIDGSHRERIDVGSDIFAIFNDQIYLIGLDSIVPNNFHKNEINFINSKIDFIGEYNILKGWMYFSNTKDKSTLYKMDISSSVIEKINNDKIWQITPIKNWIYYINCDDENKLYRIHPDGTNREKITDDGINYVNAYKDWVFFTEYSGVYRINTENNIVEKLCDDSSWTLTIIGDWIFYVKYPSWNIYRMHLDGSDKKMATVLN